MAPIYMASAWSGTSIKEYASYFDTIYISLAKYLGDHRQGLYCAAKNTHRKNAAPHQDPWRQHVQGTGPTRSHGVAAAEWF